MLAPVYVGKTAGTAVSGSAAAAGRLPQRRPKNKVQNIAKEVLVMEACSTIKFPSDIASSLMLPKTVLRKGARLPCWCA